MARICHVTTAHRADDVRIFRKECRSLAAAGHEVVLIAFDCDGERREDGVLIRALAPRRGRIARMLLGAVDALQAVLRLRPQLVHFHDPEFLPAALALRLLGYRVVYDAHEDVPASIRGKHYLPAFVRVPLAALVGPVERLLARCMSAVVVAAPSLGYRFPAARTTLVQNFPVLDEFTGIEDPADRRACRALVYVGAITEARGAFEMIRALELSSADRLLLAGPVRPAGLLERLQALPGWAQVEYHQWLDRRQIAALLGRASIGLSLLKPIPNFLGSQPIKLYEYFASGLAVVISDFPGWTRWVSRSGGDTGLQVDPEDPAAIAAAIDRLLDDPEQRIRMGRTAREVVATEANWADEARALLALYARLLS